MNNTGISQNSEHSQSRGVQLLRHTQAGASGACRAEMFLHGLCGHGRASYCSESSKTGQWKNQEEKY